MKLGLFSVVDHYPEESGRSVGRYYDQLLEQAQLADQVGFNSFWVAEHHFSDYGVVPRPPVLLAAISQKTKNIRLGSAVVVLPFDNPLRTAEDYAMVDVLSKGRLNLGVGSGYLKHEYDGFAIDSSEKRERFDEALKILQKAWSGKRFSYTGKFHRVSDVKLNVVPCQQPMPPLSVAILRNEAARFVGRNQLSILMIPYASSDSLEQLEETVAEYNNGFVEAGGKREDARVTFALHAHCAETSKEAENYAIDSMHTYVESRLFARQRSFEELAEKKLLAVGDPASLVETFKAYQDIGVSELLLITNFGAMPHQKVMASLNLIGEKVMPELENQSIASGVSLSGAGKN